MGVDISSNMSQHVLRDHYRIKVKKSYQLLRNLLLLDMDFIDVEFALNAVPFKIHENQG